jgi:hypothetical protein
VINISLSYHQNINFGDENVLFFVAASLSRWLRHNPEHNPAECRFELMCRERSHIIELRFVKLGEGEKNAPLSTKEIDIYPLRGWNFFTPNISAESGKAATILEAEFVRLFNELSEEACTYA